MKYQTHVYAKALAETIAEAKGKENDEVVKRFLALVRKNGDGPHLRKIVEEAARFARGKSGVRKVTLESARTLTAARKQKLQAFMRAGDVLEERIDPELVAGVKIILNDELQFDGSLKGKLDRLLMSHS